MIQLEYIAAPTMAVILAVWLPPVAHAEESVTYRVDSPAGDIEMANGIEYFDGSRRILLQNVALPWEATVMVTNPTSVGFDGAEVRADWRPAARPSKWVSARVYFGDKLICDNTLDVGNAACYGSSKFKS